MILFGEHAVVYGRPAIAVPVTDVQATATVEAAPSVSGLTLIAADLGTRLTLDTAPKDDPLAAAARLTLNYLSAPPPDAVLTIRSTIPIASGLGSGAAVSTALVRSLAGFLGHALSPAEVSDLVFEVEKIHHGTPSGIDNTVIAYEQPVCFGREQVPRMVRLNVGTPFTLLVANTGLPSPTKRLVERVRRARRREPARYEALFDHVGTIVEEARQAIETGDVSALGPLMGDNHELLIELGVSSSRLDELVDVAHSAGALGAKLSGAGRGGNIVVLTRGNSTDKVAEALRGAGAARVICTSVRPQD